MGQEAYAMFPMLARASAEAQLARAQAGNYDIQQQQFQQGNRAATVFGNAFGNGAPPIPGAQPGPYAPPPQPGQASQPGGSAPMNPYITGPGGTGGAGAGFQPFKPAPAGIRVPQAGGPAMTGPVTTGPVDDLTRGGGDLPQAAQPPAPAAQPLAAAAPAGAPHKWTPAPGETFNTPDGSRPRSLDEVMGALRKANPKADPATLARAAGLYMPWLQEEDQVRLREEMMRNTAAMNNLRVTAAGDRQQVAEAGKDARLGQVLTAKDAIAQLRSDDRAKALQVQVDRYTQLAADAAKRQDLNGAIEMRRRAMAISDELLNYSRSMDVSTYITDPAEKKAYDDEVQRQHDATKAALGLLPGATESAPNSKARSGNMGVLDLAPKKVGPGAMNYNPKDRRIEAVG